MQRMKDFYTRVLGLHVTDESRDSALVFLSSRPDVEHHEVLLTSGREDSPGSRVLQQLSFHVGSLEEIRQFYSAFKKEGVPISSIVTHGNTVSIYFLDPEGNRLEVYFSLSIHWPQPFMEPIDIEQDDEGILRQVQEIIKGSSQSRTRV
jgi:catechol-2,3-dioxygenase